MASLHKSASKLNATKKRKSGDDMEDEDLPLVSVKAPVKRRKDKVSFVSSFESRKRFLCGLPPLLEHQQSFLRLQ
jgi:hypothetical protein